MNIFASIGDMFSGITGHLDSAATALDSVVYGSNQLTEYLGYVHYFMGDYAYYLLTTVFFIALVINVLMFAWSIIGKLKNLLPW